jgi:hypothetical protein
MICKPEAVVMGFPAVWADAVVAITGVEMAAAMAANAVWMIVRREDRIFNCLSSIIGTCLAQPNARCHPAGSRKYAGLEIQPGETRD